MFRKTPRVGGAAAPVYTNPARSNINALVIGFWALFFMAGTGIICNKMMGELCSVLQHVLLLMVAVSISSAFLLTELEAIRHTHDLAWLCIIFLGFAYIIVFGIYLYWSVFQLVDNIWLSGEHDVCSGTTGNCRECNPLTFWYTMVATCISASFFVVCNITLFTIIVPSVFSQAYYRSEVL
jgi:hypothetical protein